MDFKDIYDKYIDVVYSFLKFKIHDQHLIEDIIQETFLSVYKGLETLQNKASIKSWILSIAHNKMVDKLRKSNLETPKEIDDNLIEAQDNLDADDIFVDDLLNNLDETSSQILYGIYVEGLTYGDLANVLNIPEGTVKSKCYYARKKLRNVLVKGESLNG